MLTKTQIDLRSGKLTASRVAILVKDGTEEERKRWHYDLWLELIRSPKFIPEDLSDVWAVRLGETTEALNLEWFERKNGPVSRRGQVVMHSRFSWAAATLDGWCDELNCPIECKHVGGREPLEVIIDRYQPQMQWQMECTGATQCALSVIMGANEPIIEFIEWDEEYAGELVKRGIQFMDFVHRKVPPVVLEPVAPPAVASRIVDMTGNNMWAYQSGLWCLHKVDAEICRDAEKTLKSLVPEDAKKCHGHGVQITRDRAGRLSLREAQ